MRDASNPAVATSTVFLDLSDRTRALGEQGLLGMAFDPDYAANRFVYVYYCADAHPDVNIGDLSAKVAAFALLLILHARSIFAFPANRYRYLQ